MEITKREILVSIIIFFLLIGLGLIIHNFIIEKNILSIEKFNKALKIDNNAELFNYSIDTEVGNILAYGTFTAIDKVSIKELKNEYMYIEKVKQRYTRHSRQVCSTDSKGNTKCRTEYYYSWDDISSEDYTSKKIMFLGRKFNYSTFYGYSTYRLSLSNNVVDEYKNNVNGNYLYEEKPSFWGSSEGDIRYYYVVGNISFNGTIFAKCGNKNIIAEKGNKIEIHSSNLSETIENKKNKGTIISVLYWIFWLILTGFAIYGYMYLDNNYLEN